MGAIEFWTMMLCIIQARFHLFIEFGELCSLHCHMGEGTWQLSGKKNFFSMTNLIPRIPPMGDFSGELIERGIIHHQRHLAVAYSPPHIENPATLGQVVHACVCGGWEE